MFYGWFVVLAGVLLNTASLPGHTFGINPFVEEWVAEDELNMSRVSFSNVWFVSSLVPALLAPLFGYALDKFGSRTCALAMMPVYILSVFVVACAHNAYVLSACVCLMRLVGSEFIPMLSQTAIQLWFERKRGKAASLLGVGEFILFLSPALLGYTIEFLGWRNSFLAQGVVYSVLTVIALSLLRDSPAVLGLRPDNDKSDKSIFDVTTAGGPVAELVQTWEVPLPLNSISQAVRHPLFWSSVSVYGALTLFWGGFNTLFVSLAKEVVLHVNHTTVRLPLLTKLAIEDLNNPTVHVK